MTTRSRRPFETLRRWGKLRSVLGPHHNAELHALIARVCVLYEDLRIEVAGIAADNLARLDEAGTKGREVYFLRRSMGTLFEFSDALKNIDRDTAFARIRNEFDANSLRLWERSIAYFKKHERTIKQVRHNVGGHFGAPAAELAVRHFEAAASGWVEIAFYAPQNAGATLGFASEIAATALVRNVQGLDNGHRVRRLIRIAVLGYRHAVRAVDCITGVFLWERFGR